MDSRRCVACGKKFRICPQVRHQQYCMETNCQRERRRKTQQLKRKTDPDYKENQARAQQAWLTRNPDYSREYRRTHPKYNELNREKQKQRNQKRKKKLIAKSDVSEPTSSPLSGIYRLIPVMTSGIAKMDEWLVEIKFVSDT